MLFLLKHMVKIKIKRMERRENGVLEEEGPLYLATKEKYIIPR
jgi:hypothetical protein